MIINRGEAEVDNHFLRVSILTITFSGMYYYTVISCLFGEESKLSHEVPWTAQCTIARGPKAEGNCAIELSTVPRGTVLTILPNRHEIYLKPKVTLHCLFINLFRKFVSDIWKVFNSCINLIIYSYTVGKQTPCKLSFVYTSQVNLTVCTEPKFGKDLMPFM